MLTNKFNVDFSGQYAYAQYENKINNILTPEAAFYNVYSMFLSATIKKIFIWGLFLTNTTLTKLIKSHTM